MDATEKKRRSSDLSNDLIQWDENDDDEEEGKKVEDDEKVDTADNDEKEAAPA